MDNQQQTLVTPRAHTYYPKMHTRPSSTRDQHHLAREQIWHLQPRTDHIHKTIYYPTNQLLGATREFNVNFR